MTPNVHLKVSENGVSSYMHHVGSHHYRNLPVTIGTLQLSLNDPCGFYVPSPAIES